MKKNLVLYLTIILAFFCLYFLMNTIDIYNVEQRTIAKIDGTTYPDALIITEDGSVITNPEIASYEIEMDLNFELLGMTRDKLVKNKNILLLFVVLFIGSLIIWTKMKW